MVTARMIVEGNVQSVGYRALVKQTAKVMGIRGYVKNLDDGTVEIYCEADKSTIEAFKKRIDKKSEYSDDVFSLHVKNILPSFSGQEDYVPPSKELKTFEIDYGGEGVESDRDRMETGSYLLTDSRIETKIFRTETNENFQELKQKYHVFSKDIKSIKKDVSKFKNATKNIETMFGGYIEEKLGKK